MKKIILCAIFLTVTLNVYAQKKYVDPNIRNKKGLLEPGESASLKTEVSSTATTESSKNDDANPVIKKYCACFNSKRLSEAKRDLASNLQSKGTITYEEYRDLDTENEFNRKVTLLKKYTLSIDVDVDEIECELVNTSYKKPKDFKKPLEALDSVCKFDEIERKKI